MQLLKNASGKIWGRRDFRDFQKPKKPNFLTKIINKFFRRIATFPTDKIPVWSRNTDISILVPALFVGAWEDRKAGDRALVSAVAGMPYENDISSIYPYTKGENAPLFYIDGSYQKDYCGMAGAN